MKVIQVLVPVDNVPCGMECVRLLQWSKYVREETVLAGPTLCSTILSQHQSYNIISEHFRNDGSNTSHMTQDGVAKHW